MCLFTFTFNQLNKESFSMGTSTLESLWIERNMDIVAGIENGTITSLREYFGPYIPLFVDWTAAYRRKSCSVRGALRNCNNEPDFLKEGTILLKLFPFIFFGPI